MVTRIHAELSSGWPSGLPPAARSAVTVGVFDGVHRGHQQLLRSMAAAAASRGLTPVVVTFKNHPLSVLRPELPLQLLTPLAERTALIRSAGITGVVAITFTRELSQWTPEQFIGALIEHLHMGLLVVGPDFVLGHGRAGTTPVLTALGERLGYATLVVPPYLLDGQPVKSTLVRQALAAGDMERAAHYLGRPFAVAGAVEPGERRGASLGFPTANLALTEHQALPVDGIYAAWFDVDGARHPAAASIGTKPTFHEAAPRTVEAYVLDFSGDLYGKGVRLEFVQLLRAQQRFLSAADLVAQMQRDVQAVRAVLAAGAAAP